MKLFAMDNNKINLTQEQLKKIANYIQKEGGILLDKNRLMRFKRKLENVLIQNDIKNFQDFYHRLRFKKDVHLKQEIFNAVTINETYFWRENNQFDYLANILLPTYITQGKPQNIRILTAPCSSGEEVYSIVFAILENREVFNNLNIELIGIDIDSFMITKAKRAIYTKRSVEKLPKKYLKKYFKEINSFYHLDRKLRNYANFLQGNIFDTNFINKLGKFDIIFSRNMLIYFNDNDKQKAIEIFHRLLNSNGIIFLGHADTNMINHKLFIPLKTGLHIYKKDYIQNDLNNTNQN